MNQDFGSQKDLNNDVDLEERLRRLDYSALRKKLRDLDIPGRSKLRTKEEMVDALKVITRDRLFPSKSYFAIIRKYRRPISVAAGVLSLLLAILPFIISQTPPRTNGLLMHPLGPISLASSPRFTLRLGGNTYTNSQPHVIDRFGNPMLQVGSTSDGHITISAIIRSRYGELLGMLSDNAWQITDSAKASLLAPSQLEIRDARTDMVVFEVRLLSKYDAVVNGVFYDEMGVQNYSPHGTSNRGLPCPSAEDFPSGEAIAPKARWWALTSRYEKNRKEYRAALRSIGQAIQLWGQHVTNKDDPFLGFEFAEALILRGEIMQELASSEYAMVDYHRAIELMNASSGRENFPELTRMLASYAFDFGKCAIQDEDLESAQSMARHLFRAYQFLGRIGASRSAVSAHNEYVILSQQISLRQNRYDNGRLIAGWLYEWKGPSFGPRLEVSSKDLVDALCLYGSALVDNGELSASLPFFAAAKDEWTADQYFASKSQAEITRMSECTLTYSKALYYFGRPLHAIDMLDEAIDLERKGDIEHFSIRRRMISALRTKSYYLEGLGRTSEAACVLEMCINRGHDLVQTILTTVDAENYCADLRRCALLYYRIGNADIAEELLFRAIHYYEQHFGDWVPPGRAYTWLDLGELALDTNRWEEAVGFLTNAIRDGEAVRGDGYVAKGDDILLQAFYRRGRAFGRLESVQEAFDDSVRAIEYYHEAVELIGLYSPHLRFFAKALHLEQEMLRRMGRIAEADHAENLATCIDNHLLGHDW